MQTRVASSSASKSADFFSACRFYSADNISAYLFVDGTNSLAGDYKARRFIESSAERPEDVITYFKMELESLHSMTISIWRHLTRAMGLKASETGRARPAMASGKKVAPSNTEWYGGTGIRDFGFKQFMASRKAFENGDISVTTDDPVSAKLAANAIAGECEAGSELQTGDDSGIRKIRLADVKGEQSPEIKVSYRNQGCASECMDQLLAGLDTAGDTLSYGLHLLSLPENANVQERLRCECQSLRLPISYDQSLPQETLVAVQMAPYIEAVLKETLRRFPASTTALQRVVPSSGRMLDGFLVPEGVVIGASPVTTNNDKDVFDRHERLDVATWAPERWLDADAEVLAEMNRLLWTFGSGAQYVRAYIT